MIAIYFSILFGISDEFNSEINAWAYYLASLRGYALVLYLIPVKYISEIG